MREAQGGSPDAVERLVRKHWDGAHRTAYLIVHDAAAAEDIAQEAMLAAVGAIDDFDRRRPFRPWLHRIVVNRALDWLRASRRRGEVSGEGVHAAEGSPSASLSGELMKAFGALDAEERAIVVLRHLLDYRSSEIARMLDLPAATVRTKLRRSLARLRMTLEEDER